MNDPNINVWYSIPFSYDIEANEICYHPNASSDESGNSAEEKVPILNL